jgi:hypothetical protein
MTSGLKPLESILIHGPISGIRGHDKKRNRNHCAEEKMKEAHGRGVHKKWKITLGIITCLLGENVRYDNGTHPAIAG